MLNFLNKKCLVCEQLKYQNEYLQKQVKDLLDRLMAFNQDAFIRYQAEVKPKENLYPSAIDEKGNQIIYNSNPEEAEAEAMKILGGNPITVDEFPEEVAAREQNERA